MLLLTLVALFSYHSSIASVHVNVVDVLKPIILPINKSMYGNYSVAIEAANKAFTTIEQIFESYIAIADVKTLDNKSEHICGVYMLHSLLTPKYFEIVKMAFKDVVMPFVVDNKPLALHIPDYIQEVFNRFSGAVFSNMALRSGNPLANGFLTEAKTAFINKIFPKICRNYLQKLMRRYWRPSTCILSKERSQNLKRGTFFNKTDVFDGKASNFI